MDFPRCVAALPLALCAAGCITGGQTLDGSDYHVHFPAARASFEIERKGAADEHHPGSCRLTLEATRAPGSSTQPLGAGESQRFKGVDFPGPDTLALDFELHAFNAWFALGDSIAPNVRGAALVGISAFERDLAIEGASAHVSDADIFVLPLVGAELEWEPVEHLSAYARYLLACDEEDDLAPVLRMFETGLRARLHRNLALFAGWRDWRYDEERTFESDVDLNLEGGVLGVELCF